MLKRRLISCLVIGLSLTSPAFAAISDDVVRIGVLTDDTTFIAAASGQGSVIAAQMAAEDFGGVVAARPIEIIAADHESRPDVAVGIVNRWLKSKSVDAIVGVTNSTIALRLVPVVQGQDKVMLLSGAGAPRLTEESCSPNVVQWTHNYTALVNAAVDGLGADAGKGWYLLVGDSTYGRDLQAKTLAAIKRHKGTVVGTTIIPLNAKNIAQYLQKADASGARNIALVMGGEDGWRLINAMTPDLQNSNDKARIVAFVLGAQLQARGPVSLSRDVVFALPFDSNLNDATRSFAMRFSERAAGKMPTLVHAGIYAGVMHYLKSISALRSDESGAQIVARMKAMETDDPLFGRGRILASGRKIHDMYFCQRAPAQPITVMTVKDVSLDQHKVDNNLNNGFVCTRRVRSGAIWEPASGDCAM